MTLLIIMIRIRYAHDFLLLEKKIRFKLTQFFVVMVERWIAVRGRNEIAICIRNDHISCKCHSNFKIKIDGIFLALNFFEV